MRLNETNAGDRCMLTVLLPRDARELREANRRVPAPGEYGTIMDKEPAGFVVPHDLLQVKMDAHGDDVWLPAFCFRKA